MNTLPKRRSFKQVTGKFTKQQTFNKIAKHLLTQLEVAADGSRCRYRTDGGRLMCAVGCLIPDGEYSPDMEGSAITNRLLRSSPSLRKHDFTIMTDLQYIHDDAATSHVNALHNGLHQHWSQKLCEFASQYSLSTRWIAHLLYYTPNEAS